MVHELETTDPIPDSKRKVFFGLFVFPMLIAVTMALLLSGVVLLTHEEETPESLITAIKTGAPSKRWQKAFELSNELNREAGLLRSAGVMKEAIHILNDKDHYDAQTRAYMAMALSRFQNPDAEAALRQALRETDDQEDPKMPLFLMWALGNMKSRGAALDATRFLESTHDELRKTAAYVLGVLGDEQAIPFLERSLEDSVADVRWNAALSLARLGDNSGGDTLVQMLDRSQLQKIHQMKESEIERVMINAARGIGLIRIPGAVQVLKNISEGDPNLKVRETALESLKALS